jgi:hypothetical protein
MMLVSAKRNRRADLRDVRQLPGSRPGPVVAQTEYLLGDDAGSGQGYPRGEIGGGPFDAVGIITLCRGGIDDEQRIRPQPVTPTISETWQADDLQES